jgi:hypothetical protein
MSAAQVWDVELARPDLAHEEHLLLLTIVESGQSGGAIVG